MDVSQGCLVAVFVVWNLFGTCRSLGGINEGAVVTITFDEHGMNFNLTVHTSLNGEEKLNKHTMTFRKTPLSRPAFDNYGVSGSGHFYKPEHGLGLLRVVKIADQKYKARGHICVGTVKISLNNAVFKKDLVSGSCFGDRGVKLSRCNDESSTSFDKLSPYGLPNNRPVHVNQTNGPSQSWHTEGKGHSRHSTQLSRRRRKRVVDETYTVELLIVVDYEAYYRWNRVFSRDDDPLEKTKQYYSYIVHGIDSRFRSIQNQQPSINMALAGFIIAQTKEESFWTSTSTIGEQVVVDDKRLTINASEALEKFQAWLDKNIDELPHYDHAMLFTGGDLTYAGNTGNTGLAFAESMCRNISNSSIVEEAFDFRTVTYSTRQIARSLGARDDMDNNDCLEFFNFIMAPKLKLPIKSFPENRWKFSTCTVQYFSDYISKIKEDGINCLQELAFERRFPEKVMILIQELPGMIYSAKQQCQYHFGARSDICRSSIKPSTYNKLCTGLLCTVPGSDECSYILPAEGTTCGNRKYCYEGQCLQFEDAKPSLDTCTFGDDPNNKCKKRISNKPFLCYTESVRFSCCLSCSKVEIGLPGCEYGDRKKSCLLKHCKSDNTTVDTVCCRTCADGPVPDLPSTDDWFTVSTAISAPSTQTSTTTMSTVSSLGTKSIVTDGETSLNTPAKKVINNEMSSSVISMDTNTVTFAADVSAPISSLETLSDIDMFTYPTWATEPNPSLLSSSTARENTHSSSIQSGASTRTTSRLTTTTPIPLITSSLISKASTVSPLVSQTTGQLKATTVASNMPSSTSSSNATLDAISTTSSSKWFTTTLGNSASPMSTQRNKASTSGLMTAELPTTTLRIRKTTETLHSTTIKRVSLADMDLNKEHVTSIIETNAANTEPCASETTLDKQHKHPEPTMATKPVPTKPTMDCANICKANQQTSEISNDKLGVYDLMFFKELARSMRNHQRRIRQRVQNSIKYLYLGVTRQIRRHQESDTESIIYNDVVNPRSEIPSQDDDDINRLLIPVWRRQHNLILRTVERDIRQMRYKVLMMVNRYLRH